MKNRKRLAMLLLLVLAVLFGGLYLYERSQKAKLWNVVNQYEANQFFSALDYLQDWEVRLDGTPYTKADLQAERDSLSGTAVSLQEAFTIRTRLLGADDVLRHPSNLTDFLMRTDRQLSAMINSGGKDLTHLKEISLSLKKINRVSREVYRFESGLTSEQWDEISKTGFMQDERLIEWYTQVEAALAP
ncbi:hypothetical protein [Tumebacillus avium]|uniref:hypothetical protein n=1 Tax=Tumebacillus avium TaxID=1903704 RepID=UPI0012FD057C|nr:hypothetical protein [Tumebacillus avium]